METNFDELLKGILAGPSQDDRSRAMNMGILQTGLGLLARKNLGEAGMLGVQAGQGMLDKSVSERKNNIAAALQMMKIKKDMEGADALKKASEMWGANTGGAPSPQAAQAALTEGAAQGDIGPTMTNAQRIPPQQQTQNPLSQKLSIVRGVMLSGNHQQGQALLKLLEMEHPELQFSDRGDALVGTDKRTGAIVSTMPKGQSPDSSARIAEDRRQFGITRGSLSAPQQVDADRQAEELRIRQAQEARTNPAYRPQTPANAVGFPNGHPLAPAALGFPSVAPGGAATSWNGTPLRTEADARAAVGAIPQGDAVPPGADPAQVLFNSQFPGGVSPQGQPPIPQPQSANVPLIQNPSLPIPEKEKLTLLQPREESAATSFMQRLGRIRDTATELKDHPGLPDIVGKVDQYPILDLMPQTRNARALQGAIIKQTGIEALQSMRAESKTGGAVGQVTEREWPILQQSLAALDAAQTPAAYKVALNNLINQIEGSISRVQTEYKRTYGDLNYKPVPHLQQNPRPSGASGSFEAPASRSMNPALDAALKKYGG